MENWAETAMIIARELPAVVAILWIVNRFIKFISTRDEFLANVIDENTRAIRHLDDKLGELNEREIAKQAASEVMNANRADRER